MNKTTKINILAYASNPNNDSYFDADLLSEKLLNSEIDAVGSSDSKIVIRLKGGVLDD